VEAGNEPAVALSNQHLGNPKLTRDLAALEGRLLDLRTDSHRGICVHPHANVSPVEGLLLQLTRSARAEVLLFVEYEPERSDAHEICVEQRAEGVSVSA
jgi:hypothetical protein